MPRSITAIQAEIIANVQSDVMLSTRATSASLVAEWRLWTYIFAVAVNAFEHAHESAKLYIEKLGISQKAGTPDWIVGEAKKFQYNFPLIVKDGVVTYADTTSVQAIAAQIIKRASWSIELGVFKLKVAGEDVDGLPIPILGIQKTAFDAYMDRVIFAGMAFNIESKYADKLAINLTVYHNPLIDPAALTVPINDAVKEYLRNIPFNGIFMTDRMFDKIQPIEHITTSFTNSLQVASNNGPLDSNYTAFQPVGIAWKSKAGYLKLNAPITITYSLDTNL